ncbi:MAG TPA: hypothetical protein VHP38_03615 [Ruminiclostridium sp.]|nr:hypothetical protein [Ruminiclostridium sp.]
MSKENAIRFLMAKNKDECVKSAFNTIMDQYAGRYLSEDERDKILREEIIPMAKKHGYDLTPEDFNDLKKTAPERLEDEELDMVAGGRGQIDEYLIGTTATILTDTIYCNCAPDNQTFIMRYNIYSDNHCPDYSYVGRGRDQRICPCCKNLSIDVFYSPYR